MSHSQAILREGLIVILRQIPQEKLLDIAQALYEGGARILEIAFDPLDPNTIAHTAQMIRAASAELADRMLVGAGTVLCEEALIAAYNAGAKFIFSPDTDSHIIRLTKQLGLVSIPGAYTPTECKAAWKHGADLVKLFPITKDEIPYFVNICRPLPHIPFLCVGGVSIETIPMFFGAGAKGVATGLSIVSPALVEAEDYAEITRRTRAHVQAVKAAMEQAKG